MSWGIAETASEIEKIKSESADYLNGLNSCGVIDWNTYNYAFDFYADLLMKAYEQGMKDAQSEIVRCKDCKHWKQQTNYQGSPLSFGFCESDDMWRSLYGETYEVSHIDTDDDHYCGYAERRTD